MFITDIKSFDFVLNNAFRKIFLTKSYDVANECILFSAVQFLMPYIQENLNF